VPDLKIVELPTGNLQDIPALIETVAKQTRDGEFGKVVAGVCVLINDDGEPQVFGWGGDTDDVRGIGLLTLGAQWLSARKVKR
jgi:hypothetical protein